MLLAGFLETPLRLLMGGRDTGMLSGSFPLCPASMVWQTASFDQSCCWRPGQGKPPQVPARGPHMDLTSDGELFGLSCWGRMYRRGNGQRLRSQSSVPAP